VRAVFLFFFFAQQMGYAAKLLGSALQGLNLLAQLGLLGLFLSENFMDISHATAS